MVSKLLPINAAGDGSQVYRDAELVDESMDVSPGLELDISNDIRMVNNDLGPELPPKFVFRPSTSSGSSTRWDANFSRPQTSHGIHRQPDSFHRQSVDHKYSTSITPPTPEATPPVSPELASESFEDDEPLISEFIEMTSAAGIGMAFGSPTHPPVARQLFPTEQSTAVAESLQPPHQPLRAVAVPVSSIPKHSKWKKLGELFGKKNLVLEDAPYRLQVEDLSRDGREKDTTIYPSPPASADTLQNRRSVSPQQEMNLVWESEKTITASVELRHGSENVDNTLDETHHNGGRLLNVEIPNVQLERYSVMFDSLLNSTSQPSSSLPARRQATLEKLKSVTEAIEDIQVQKQQQRFNQLAPRRATSPILIKTPTLSLWPSTPSKTRDTFPSLHEHQDTGLLQHSSTFPIASPSLSTAERADTKREGVPHSSTGAPAFLGHNLNVSQIKSPSPSQPESPHHVVELNQGTAWPTTNSPLVASKSSGEEVITVDKDEEITVSWPFPPSQDLAAPAPPFAQINSTSSATASRFILQPDHSQQSDHPKRKDGSESAPILRSSQDEAAAQSAVSLSIARQISMSQLQRESLKRVQLKHAASPAGWKANRQQIQASLSVDVDDDIPPQTPPKDVPISAPVASRKSASEAHKSGTDRTRTESCEVMNALQTRAQPQPHSPSVAQDSRHIQEVSKNEKHRPPHGSSMAPNSRQAPLSFCAAKVPNDSKPPSTAKSSAPAFQHHHDDPYPDPTLTPRPLQQRTATSSLRSPAPRSILPTSKYSSMATSSALPSSPSHISAQILEFPMPLSTKGRIGPPPLPRSSLSSSSSDSSNTGRDVAAASTAATATDEGGRSRSTRRTAAGRPVAPAAARGDVLLNNGSNIDMMVTGLKIGKGRKPGVPVLVVTPAADDDPSGASIFFAGAPHATTTTSPTMTPTSAKMTTTYSSGRGGPVDAVVDGSFRGHRYHKSEMAILETA